MWPRTAGNRQVKIRFLNPMPSAHTAVLTITGASYTTSLGATTLSVTPTSSELSFPANGEAEKTLTISGLPNYVAKGEMAINFTLVANSPGGTSLGGGIATELFQTEASPLGIQNPVWWEVLEDACSWAIGQSSQAGVRLACTANLFTAGIFVYESTRPYFTTFVDDTYLTEKFSLKKLISTRASSSDPTNGDCQDVSNYLLISWLALGVSGGHQKHYRDISPHTFDTHYVIGIGLGTTLESYTFDFHQTIVVSGLVYDAACRQLLALDGNPTSLPPAGWDLSGYWQTPNPDPPPGGSNFLGLVWRRGGSSLPGGETVGRTSSVANLVGYVE